MIPEIYLIISLMVVFLGLIAWFINAKISQLAATSKQDENLLKIIENLQKMPESLQKGLQEQSKNLQQVLGYTNKNISDTLQKSNKTVNERLDNAARYISQVAKEVGHMSEIGRSMKDLQEFLKSPKLRGNIGEEVLKDLITQMFPKNSFHLQHVFKSGEKVDAALKTDAGILPIDSKFPMENFQKMVKAETKDERTRTKREFISDVKKHIKDIARKYILPEEGTMDFALMYIPSEAVYYEIVNLTELTNLARLSRVYPVSPTTLYAQLQMILLSYEGKKIETKSREVFRMLRAIQKDYEKTNEALQVLGKHINNTYNQYNAKVMQSFSLMGQKLSSTQSISEPSQEDKQLKSET